MRYAKIEITELPDSDIFQRKRLCSGNHILLNEKDVLSLGEGTFEEIVTRLGGVILSNHDAKVELSKRKYKWHNKQMNLSR
jgi:hypothetical protein